MKSDIRTFVLAAISPPHPLPPPRLPSQASVVLR